MTKHANLAAALAAAQAEFKPLVMDKMAKIPTSKGTYSYGYASLAAVLESVLPALNKHGIAMVQRTSRADNGLIIHTELILGEEKLASEWPLAILQRPQDTGANLTYYRRYALTSLVGIAAEETDDESAQEAGDSAVKKERREARLEPHKGEHPTSGKLNKTELKYAARDFRHDLEGLSSNQELVGFLNDNVEMTAQIMRDLPGWWYGDNRSPDVEPLQKAIERRQRELRDQEITGIKPEPGGEEDLGAGEPPVPTEPML